MCSASAIRCAVTASTWCRISYSTVFSFKQSISRFGISIMVFAKKVSRSDAISTVPNKLLLILAPEDQRNDQAEETDRRHNSENAWNTEFPFDDWEKKDAEGCAQLRNAGGESSSCCTQLRRKYN